MQYSSTNGNTELKALQRIIMWLCAFAVLCERAAVAPAPVRFTVLWMLRGGECMVRDYAEEMAQDLGYLLQLPEPPLAWQGDSADDAMRLASQFLVLAEIFQMLAACVALDETAGASTLEEYAKHRSLASVQRCQQSLVELDRLPMGRRASSPRAPP